VLATVAVRYAAYGKTERAVQIANENPFEVSRFQALIEIAKVCAHAGNDEVLESVVGEIPAPLEKVMAIVGAAFIKLENGAREIASKDLEQAHAIAPDIEQVSARCELLGEIALGFSLAGAQTRARDVAHEALRIVSSIRDEPEKVNALANLSSVFSRAGIEVDDEDRAELKKLVVAAVF
jgi:hypothetical protein